VQIRFELCSTRRIMTPMPLRGLVLSSRTPCRAKVSPMRKLLKYKDMAERVGFESA